MFRRSHFLRAKPYIVSDVSRCGSALLEDLERVAIHEAGHALMFDALEVPIELVTVEPSEVLKFDGHVRLASDSNNVLSVLAGTMAGPAASFYIVE